MRSVADQPIIEAIAKALDCEQYFVSVRRTVDDTCDPPRERVQVVVSSWAILLHDDPSAVVTRVLNEVLHGPPRTVPAKRHR